MIEVHRSQTLLVLDFISCTKLCEIAIKAIQLFNALVRIELRPLRVMRQKDNGL